MKKTRLFTLFALIILSLLLLVGCDKMITGDSVSSIYLKDHDPNTAIEINAGDFNFDAYTLVITYESGTTQEVALVEELIEPADRVKFYQVGDHDIRITYAKTSYVFKISVKRLTFGDISFPENNVFTYDGTEHVVEVQGDIPANATVTYLTSNSFVNAGVYHLSAVVSCEGYVTATLSTTVTVERARYDMSGTSLEAKEVAYNGSSHSLTLTGSLPEGVGAPIYTINGQSGSSAINVGTYDVKVSFANSDPNYESIPDMQSTLKITPARIDTSGLDLVFRSENGAVVDGTKKVYDGCGVTFDLNDYSKLADLATVTFSVYGQDGKLLSTSNKKTNIMGVGVYTVKAEFSLLDSQNYLAIEPIVRTFTVDHASYPMSEVLLRSESLTYDGLEHSIRIEGRLPEDVEVFYEYYLNGELLLDSKEKPVQSVKDSGKYTVKARFSVRDANYADIPELTATLEIEKVRIDTALLGIVDGRSAAYNGQPYDSGLTTWKELTGNNYDVLLYGDIIYYQLNALGEYVQMPEGEMPTEIGSYKLEIAINVAEEYVKNYALSLGGAGQTYICRFEITRASLLVPDITFASNPAGNTYTGEGLEIPFTHTADTNRVTVTQKYYMLVGDEYVAMGENELPTAVGAYKTVVEITANDPTHFVFANKMTTVTAECRFNISHFVIKVPQISFEGNASTITYDTNAHTVAFTHNANESLVSISCKYFTVDGESLTPMAEGDEPTKAGLYAFVVTASIVDTENYIFETGETYIYRTVTFEIEKRELAIPEYEYSIDENAEYSGKAQPIEGDFTAKSLFEKVSTVYQQLVDGVYVDMADGEAPTYAGKYRLIVTTTIIDPSCIFATITDDKTTAELVLEFEIAKKKLNKPGFTFKIDDTLFESGYSVIYNGQARPVVVNHHDVDPTIVNILAQPVRIEGESITPISGEWPKEVGSYAFIVTAEIIDTDNYIFLDDTTDMEFVHYWNIKKIEVEVPVLTITNDKTEITYDGEKHPVEYNEVAPSEYFKLTTVYYRLECDEYVEMEAGEIPTDVGKYKAVVKAEIINKDNAVFTNGEDAIISEEHAFEIQKCTIPVPTFTFTGETEIQYDGKEHPAQYSDTLDEAFKDMVKVTVSYKRYHTDGNEIPMDDRYKYPIHEGRYEFTVTIRINDTANCVFEGGYDEVKSQTFKYGIYEHIIDVNTLGFCTEYDLDKMPEYKYDGSELKYHAIEILDNDAAKKYINWEIVKNNIGGDVSKFLDEGGMDSLDSAVDKGTYQVVYKITVKNSSSCALLVNGERVTEYQITHYFKIV